MSTNDPNDPTNIKQAELDDDLDIEFDEIDLDIDFGDERSPSTKGLGARASTVAGGMVNRDNMRDMLRDSIPTHYEGLKDTSDNTIDAVKDTADLLRTKTRPIAKKFARLSEIALPKTKGLNKGVAKKINSWFGDDDDTPTRSGKSQEAIREESIGSEIEKIFAKSTRANEEIRQESDREKEKTLSPKELTNLTVSSGIERGISRLVNYNNTINNSYQKKSLELKFRMFYTLKDMYAQDKNHYTASANQNELIIKNTALPEFVKLRGTEKFKELLRDSTHRGIQDKLFASDNAIGRGVNKLKDFATTQIDGFSSALNDGLGSLIDVKEMTSDLSQGDKDKMLGSTMGGIAGKKVLGLAGKAIPKNGMFANMVRSLRETNANGRYSLQDYAKTNEAKLRELEDDPEASKGSILARKLAAGGLGIANGTTTSTEVRNGSRLSDKAGFEYNEKKSLNVIIPGFLSRILQSTESLRTGEDAGAIMFSHRDDKFISSTRDKNRTLKDLVLGSGKKENKKRVDDAIGMAEGLQDLSPEARAQLQKILSNNKFNQIDSSQAYAVKGSHFIENEELYKGMDKSIVKELKSLGEKLTENEHIDKEFNSLVLKADTGAKDIRGLVEKYAERGDIQSLISVGLVDRKDDGSYHVNMESYRDLLNSGMTGANSTTEAAIRKRNIELLAIQEEKRNTPETTVLDELKGTRDNIKSKLKSVGKKIEDTTGIARKTKDLYKDSEAEKFLNEQNKKYGVTDKAKEVIDKHKTNQHLLSAQDKYGKIEGAVIGDLSTRTLSSTKQDLANSPEAIKKAYEESKTKAGDLLTKQDNGKSKAREFIDKKFNSAKDKILSLSKEAKDVNMETFTNNKKAKDILENTIEQGKKLLATSGVTDEINKAKTVVESNKYVRGIKDNAGAVASIAGGYAYDKIDSGIQAGSHFYGAVKDNPKDALYDKTKESLAEKTSGQMEDLKNSLAKKTTEFNDKLEHYKQESAKHITEVKERYSKEVNINTSERAADTSIKIDKGVTTTNKKLDVIIDLIKKGNKNNTESSKRSGILTGALSKLVGLGKGSFDLGKRARGALGGISMGMKPAKMAVKGVGMAGGAGLKAIKGTISLLNKAFDKKDADVKDTKKKPSSGVLDLISNIQGASSKLLKSGVEKTAWLGGKVMDSIPASWNMAWNVTKKTVGMANSLATRASDVYVKGKKEPVLTKMGIKAGIYFDRESNTAIKSLKDIKGPVVNADGDMVITVADIEAGLTDKHGRPLATNMLKAFFNRIRKGRDLIKKTVSSTIKGIGKLKNKLSGKDLDMGVEGKGGVATSTGMTKVVVNRLDNILRLLDKRLPKPKKKIFGDRDGDGDRDNSVKDILQRRRAKKKAAADRKRANTRKGKAGKMGKLGSAGRGILSMLGGWGTALAGLLTSLVAPGVLKAMGKGLWKITKSASKGIFNTIKGWGGSLIKGTKDLFKGIGSKATTAVKGLVTDTGAAINKGVASSWAFIAGKTKSLYSTVAKGTGELFASVSSKLTGLTTSISKFASGTMATLGGYAKSIANSSVGRGVASAANSVKQAGSKILEGVKGAGSAIADKAGSAWGWLKNSKLGRLTGNVASYAGDKISKGAGYVAGKAGQAAGYVADKAVKVGSVLDAAGTRYGGKAYTAAKQGVKTVGKFIGKNAVKAGKYVVKKVGKKVIAGAAVALAGAATAFSGGTAAPLLAAAVSYAGAAWLAYDVVTGAYAGYKWLTTDEQKSFLKLRFLQYGIDNGLQESYPKFLQLEQLLLKSGCMQVGDGRVSFVAARMPTQKIFEIFGITEEDSEQYKQFIVWFNKRFKPVFTKYLLAGKKIGLDASIEKLDGLPDNDKLNLLSMVSFENGPYSVIAMPLRSSGDPITAISIVSYVETLRKQLKDKAGIVNIATNSTAKADLKNLDSSNKASKEKIQAEVLNTPTKTDASDTQLVQRPKPSTAPFETNEDTSLPATGISSIAGVNSSTDTSSSTGTSYSSAPEKGPHDNAGSVKTAQKAALGAVGVSPLVMAGASYAKKAVSNIKMPTAPSAAPANRSAVGKPAIGAITNKDRDGLKQSFKGNNVKGVERLAGLHPDLVAVIKAALAKFPGPVQILEGMRTKKRQRHLSGKGRSWTLKSNHLIGRAVDIAPLIRGKIPWGRNDNKDPWRRLAEVVLDTAKSMGVRMRWGGNWSEFYKFDPKSAVKDGPHFELHKSYKPNEKTTPIEGTSTGVLKSGFSGFKQHAEDKGVLMSTESGLSQEQVKSVEKETVKHNEILEKASGGAGGGAGDLSSRTAAAKKANKDIIGSEGKSSPKISAATRGSLTPGGPGAKAKTNSVEAALAKHQGKGGAKNKGKTIEEVSKPAKRGSGGGGNLLQSALNSKLVKIGKAKYGDRYASTDPTMNKFLAVESMGDAGVINSRGYAGLGQFDRRGESWEMAQKFSSENLGSYHKNKLVPEKNFAAIKGYMKYHAREMKKDGIPVTAANLYLAHQQGYHGFSTLGKLAQTGGAPGRRARKAMDTNYGKGKTPKGFLDMWRSRVDKKHKEFLGIGADKAESGKSIEDSEELLAADNSGANIDSNTMDNNLPSQGGGGESGASSGGAAQGGGVDIADVGGTGNRTSKPKGINYKDGMEIDFSHDKLGSLAGGGSKLGSTVNAPVDKAPAVTPKDDKLVKKEPGINIDTDGIIKSTTASGTKLDMINATLQNGNSELLAQIKQLVEVSVQSKDGLSKLGDITQQTGSIMSQSVKNIPNPAVALAQMNSKKEKDVPTGIFPGT